MKLLNNFYQVAGPALTQSIDATAYLLNTEKGLYLIDCGTPKGYEDCLKNIRSLGYDPKEIKVIFGTHGHFDHVGAAALFKQDFGCKLYLNAMDKNQVETGDGIATTSDMLYGMEFPPCRVDELLKDGDMFDFGNIKMEVMHTPGHTLGSVCFVLYIENLTVLVAGDTIFGGFSQYIGSDEAKWRESLDKICARHFDYFVFGHMQACLLADADARLKDARASFANYYNPWFKNFKDSYQY